MEIWLTSIISVTIGAALGFGGTLLIQKWTQERTWRREYGLKIIDKVYAPLYEEIGLLRGVFDKFGRIGAHSIWPGEEDDYIPGDKWDKIRSSYLYLMILDKDLKEGLDKFYNKRSDYAQWYSDSHDVIIKFLKNILNSEIVGLYQGDWDLIDRIMFSGHNFDTHIKDSFKNDDGGIKKGFFKSWEERDIVVPDDIFDQLLTKVNSDFSVTNIRIIRQELISKCDYLLEELSRKIEEPWKM